MLLKNPNLVNCTQLYIPIDINVYAPMTIRLFQKVTFSLWNLKWAQQLLEKQVENYGLVHFQQIPSTTVCIALIIKHKLISTLTAVLTLSNHGKHCALVVKFNFLMHVLGSQWRWFFPNFYTTSCNEGALKQYTLSVFWEWTWYHVTSMHIAISAAPLSTHDRRCISLWEKAVCAF